MGLSRSGLSGEGETEKKLLLAESFGTLFLIGLTSNLLPADIRQAKTLSYLSIFIVLFQPHGVDIQYQSKVWTRLLIAGLFLLFSPL